MQACNLALALAALRRRTPMQKGKYQIVVTQPDLLRAVWEWEVYRDGVPLPARLREGGLSSKSTARWAGRVALRDFLKALRAEQRWGVDAVNERLFRGLEPRQKLRRSNVKRLATIVPSQCWLARDALGWTTTDLARAAGVARRTVQRFERGYALKPTTLEAIQGALEKAGVVFIPANESGPGARLRK
jgi:hypothetical protein